MVKPNWNRKYKSTSKVLGVRSVSLLNAVKESIKMLKKKTNPFVIPLMCVNFKITNVITVTEMAKMVRNPVFTPNIKKRNDAISLGLPAEMFVRSIFSGDAKRGTLNIALIRNKINKEIETVFMWFWSRGNFTRIALPRIKPWKIPIPKELRTAIIEKTGSWKISTRNGISAMAN